MSNVNKQGNKRRNIYLDLSFVGSLIFLLFRIPLTNIIGNEGNGYFAVSWESYSVFGLLFGLGFSNVICEMIRKRFRKKQYKNGNNVLIAVVLIGLVLSMLGAVIIYFLSNLLLNLIHMKLSGISFRLIAILMILNTISGVFRGYFEGAGTQVPTSFSKIVEAIVFGTSAIIFALTLSKYGTKVGSLLFNPQYKPAFGATGIAAGCICGSVFSLVFLIVVHRIYQIPLKQLFKKDESRGNETLTEVLPEIIKLSFITLAELIFFKLFRITNIWIYVKNTVLTDGKDKIVQYLGSYHGKVLVVVGIVVLIILIFSGRNSRRIQKCYFVNDYKQCWKAYLDDIKQILMMGLPFVVLLAGLGKQIFTSFYKSAGNIEVTMLQIASVNIILIPIAVYTYRLLQKMDFKLLLIAISAIAFILQTVCMCATVGIGPISLIVSETIFWLLVTVMELCVATKTLKQGFKSKI